MYRVKRRSVYASEVFEFINCDFSGDDFIVDKISSIEYPQNNSIIYFEKKPKESEIKNVNSCKDILVITAFEGDLSSRFECAIFSSEARINIVNIINNFFIEIDTIKIAESSFIHKDAKLGKNLSIGENCVIGKDVQIGDNSIIQNNVVIAGNVIIGDNCIIKNNAIIGSEGYNFVVDKQGIPISVPQIGRIIIEDDVWIGSNTCIETPFINNTLLEESVKLDDLVQIGYNCHISRRTMIAAGSIISNNVVMGESTFIGLNSSIKENTVIGKNVKVGMGATVISNINSNEIVAGNPAKPIRTSHEGGE